jgi:hypothetical protein
VAPLGQAAGSVKCSFQQQYTSGDYDVQRHHQFAGFILADVASPFRNATGFLTHTRHDRTVLGILTNASRPYQRRRTTGAIAANHVAFIT